MKKQLFCEAFVPIIYGALIFAIPYMFNWDDEPTASRRQQNDLVRQIALPAFLTFYLPNVSSVSSRFILQSLVTEKQQKIRETLKLMGLSTESYGLSYMLF